jgi:hypothetical protein
VGDLVWVAGRLAATLFVPIVSAPLLVSAKCSRNARSPREAKEKLIVASILISFDFLMNATKCCIAQSKAPTWHAHTDVASLTSIEGIRFPLRKHTSVLYPRSRIALETLTRDVDKDLRPTFSGCLKADRTVREKNIV